MARDYIVRKSNPRRGSALVLSLIAATAVCASGAAFLAISTSASRRQTSEIDNLRAFYLAEAGLAEAFHAVRIGRSGQVGAEDAPAAFGDGLLWVTATNVASAQVRLTSTALVGSGRAALSYTIEPETVPLGFFSEEDLVVESVLMVDGFDSTERSYEDEIGRDQITIDREYPYLFVDKEEGLLFYEGQFYRFDKVDGDTYYYDHSLNWMKYSEEPLEIARQEGDVTQEEFAEYEEWIRDHADDLNEDDFTDDDYYDDYGDDFDGVEYRAVKKYFELVPRGAGSTGVATIPSGVLVPDGPTTGDGALFGSNGNVVFAAPQGAPIAIYGDVIPGPEAAVKGLETAHVGGDTQARSAPVKLPPVEVPPVTLAGATRHDELLPKVIAPGVAGFTTLEIAADAELIVRGPATVVIGSLVLEPGAAMTLDTRDGNVELYVTDGMDLQPGSILTTTSERSEELSVQVAAIPSIDGEAPIKLESNSQFHGTIYAPETQVYIGSEFEVYGSVVARKLEIGPGARLHFDRVDYEGSAIPEIVSWRIVEIPSAVRTNRSNPFAVLGLDPAGTLALVDAHDLSAVKLDVEYIDHSGAVRTFSGMEADFDWSSVAEVVKSDRDAKRPYETEPAGSPAEPEEPAEEPASGVRSRVQTMCDLATSTGFFAGGDVFVSMMDDYVPLSAEEWSAIYAIPGTMSATALQRLKDADLAAGGPGG